FEDPVLHKQGADWRVAAAQPFRDRYQVRAHFLLLAGIEGAGTPHAAHHLIEDEQDTVSIADVADALEIAWHRRDRAQGGADDRLGDKRDDVATAEFIDLDFELLGTAFAIGLTGLIRAALAMLVDRRYMIRFDQQRTELLALPFPASDCERTERHAMVALPARNDMAPLRLAAFHKVLARELE